MDVIILVREESALEENNLNLMSLYLSDIQKYRLLTKEEEQELFKRIREENDDQARQLLILVQLKNY